MYHYYMLGIILEDLHALTVLIVTTAYEAGIIIMSILQMRKLNHTVVKWTAQAHIAGKGKTGIHWRLRDSTVCLWPFLLFTYQAKFLKIFLPSSNTNI